MKNDKWAAFVAAQNARRHSNELSPEPAPPGHRFPLTMECQWWNMTCGNRWAGGYVKFCENPNVPDRPFVANLLCSGGGYMLHAPSLHDLERAVAYEAWRPMNRDPGDLERNWETLSEIREAIVTGILPGGIFGCGQ